MTIIADYFTLTAKHKEQYGETTIVLIQVGVFFEVYALRRENGTYIGSDIEKFTTMNDLVMAKKQSKMADDTGVMCDIMQAGFHVDHSEKYINRLQNNGYTIVIYTQDIQAKHTSRSLTEVISPGTFFTNETTQLTNHIMCIWIHKSTERKLMREQITIGTAVLDVLTGYISSSQFNREFYHTPCTYDELERIASIYNPSECIIISNLSKKYVDEIISFSSIMSKKIHIIDGLSEEYDAVHIAEGGAHLGVKINQVAIIDFRTYAQNSEKQTYQLATIEKFYPDIPCDEIIEMFPTHLIAIQSLTFLLNFVHQHSPNLVNKLQSPMFENHSDKLILANHSLKQLNILTDNKQTGKLSSVSSFLNNCVTVMGKREFSRILHNPTTNIEWLNTSYAITEYSLTNNIWEPLRSNLSGINDIEKFSRKLVLKKVNPKELSVFYNDISKLLFIYNKMKTDETINEYINNSANRNDTPWPSGYISNVCNQILRRIDNTFYIEKCSHIYHLNSEFLSAIARPGDFFIKPGISLEIDQLFDDCIHSRKKLEAIREWLSGRVASIEKSNKSAKTKARVSADALMACLAGNQNNSNPNSAQNPTEKKTNFIKIHDTPKSDPILMGTKTRINRLQTVIGSLMNKAVTTHTEKTVTLRYKDNIGKNHEFEFAYDKLEYFTIGSNKKDMGVTNKMIRSLALKTHSSEILLVSEIITFFNTFITDFTQFHDILQDIIQFTTALDILQTKCYIADKYNYNKPNIIPAEKAFFSIKGVRHPLIEHIQTNELYVTNDISLGASSNVDTSSHTVDADTEMYNGMLLYGTNAVGKTSLIKSIGIAVIMAQAGLYVPCTSFCFSPYHSIYTRILGNDNIFKGLSTFAVEMTELRTILRMADKNSLILGDELCSGTESDSALSIFTAGLEHLHETDATHLFATHFHEIQHFEEITALRKLCMKHMAVTYDEAEDCLIYDRKLRPGAGDSMYGLEVCKALHLPDDFLKRAHYLRNKYNDSQQNILGQKVSHFNAKKIKGDCENCGEKGTEVHHLQHQKEANTKNSYIGTFHKNHKANLITVCEKCHNRFHDNIEQHVRVKTTNGYKISAI